MPVELGIWRIDGHLTRIPAVPLDLESRLEDILDQEIGIAKGVRPAYADTAGAVPEGRRTPLRSSRIDDAAR
jgi:hypothetical protein